MGRHTTEPAVCNLYLSISLERIFSLYKDILLHGHSKNNQNQELSLNIGLISNLLPRWLMGKNPPADIEDVGLIPGFGRSPGGKNGDPLQYSCLGNPIDRGAWWATVHGVTNSQTRFSNWAHSQALSRLQTYLETYLKNDRMILIHLQGKPFNITVIQV